MFDCLFVQDTNVRDCYECYEFDIGWFDCLSHQDTNVRDCYECYESDILWVSNELKVFFLMDTNVDNAFSFDFIIELIWILKLTMDNNHMVR